MGKKEIEYERDFRKSKNKKIKVSVIIVAYNTGKEIIDCLDSLKKQTNKEFDIIVVDNGNENLDVLKNYDLFYIKLNKNYGPSLARNIGVSFSKSEIVAFLDDDAITDKNWVDGIISAFKDVKIQALRGKILPKSKGKMFNYLASHYDLGDKIIPNYFGIEGNCAFRRNKYVKLGGFNPKLFGAEGLDISYRAFKKGYNTIYHPKVIIYHDYADSWKHFIEKNFRHGKKNRDLKSQDDEIHRFERQYIRGIPTKQKGIFLKTRGFLTKVLGFGFFKLGYYFGK